MNHDNYDERAVLDVLGLGGFLIVLVFLLRLVVL